MGTEASKPVVAPEEFGQSGNQFQIISPMSEISCPSDINRIHRNRVRHIHPSVTTAPPVSASKPAVPRVVDPTYRASRTMANTQQPQAAAKASSSAREMPEPSHFYFPTKGTERAVERAERRNLQTEKENERPKLLKKTQNILKKTHKVMTGCFSETATEQVDVQQQQAGKSRHYDGTIGIARKVVSKKKGLGDRVSDVNAKSKSKKQFNDDDGSFTPVDDKRGTRSKHASNMQDMLVSARNSFVIREADGLVMPQDYSQPLTQTGNSAIVDMGGPALHQADDYFTRLTAGSAEESPYLQNKVYQQMPSALGGEEPDSPVSNLFNEEQESDVSILSKAITSLIESSLAESDIKRNRHSISPSTDAEDILSPSSSMMRYQKAIGTIAQTPGYYPEDDDDESDLMLSDRANDSKVQTKENRFAVVPKEQQIVHGSVALAPIEEKGDDDSTTMSNIRPEDKNTNSAFRPRSAIQQVVSLGPSASTESAGRGRRVSKLESLFRPVLPALSADDAQTVGSYDPYEIKVTESAPSVMENADYRTLALGRSDGSPDGKPVFRSEKKLGNGYSPSMVSIDSQFDTSPAMTKVTVSDQASCNGDFLFADENGKPKYLKNKGRSDRDSAVFSINTMGARSRISSRSTQAVKINSRPSEVTAAESRDDESLYSKNSERRVRFSLLDVVSASVGLAPKESIDVPTIESSLSDLTDNMARRRSSVCSSRSSILKSTTTQAKETASLATVDLTEDSTMDENPAAKSTSQDKDLKSKTNSPYIRFQSAKNRFQPKTVEVPAIENKFSDLTESTGYFGGRPSEESAKFVPDTVPEEANLERADFEATDESSVSTRKSQMKGNWSYSIKDGQLTNATPSYGKDNKNATKSPFRRFETAKSKFGNKPAKVFSPVKKGKTAMVVKRAVPYKSPRGSRNMKMSRQVKSVDGVANKIQALNQRVVEAKIDRKNHRWTKSNPRKYGVVDSNAVRTRAIVNYKTTVVGLERINYMSAAKFNSIPLDDDSSVESLDEQREKQMIEAARKPLLLTAGANHVVEGHFIHHEEDDADDVSKLTLDDMSKYTADTATVATIATIRQEQAQIPRYTGARISDGTYSTTSSGFVNIKKEVFRGSVSTSRPSMATYGDNSTTMSSILGKENSAYLPFRAAENTVKPNEQTRVAKPELHLSPKQRTPMQAQKWRTLAAAAHKRDSQKKVTTTKSRRGLAVRHANQQQPVGHFEC